MLIYRCKTFKIHGRRFNITQDLRLYELRVNGTKGIKGAEREAILNEINAQISAEEQRLDQILGVKEG